jgi:hypothetical protein
VYDPDTNPARTATVRATPAQSSAAITQPTSGPTLADVEREFSLTCWQDGDQYYARHPRTAAGDHDARGDDPADLREAILINIPETPH